MEAAEASELRSRPAVQTHNEANMKTEKTIPPPASISPAELELLQMKQIVSCPLVFSFYFYFNKKKKKTGVVQRLTNKQWSPHKGGG